MSSLVYWKAGEEGMTELANLRTARRFFQMPYGWLLSFSKPLDKQKLTESYLTADTKSRFLALYSAYLQHSKNQETSRKKFPALMPRELFFYILGEFHIAEVCCCQKDHNLVLCMICEWHEFSPHSARCQHT